MKKVLLVLGVLMCMSFQTGTNDDNQRFAKLESEVSALQSQLISLQNRVDNLENRAKSTGSSESTAVENKPVQETKSVKENTDTQCQAITQKGTRCKRQALPGSRFCWQHQNKN